MPIIPARFLRFRETIGGDVDPQTNESTLEGFKRNFCSQVQGHTPEGRDALRTTMTQPNFDWTLLTPLATFVGLCSNGPEGGQLSQTQIDWFQGERKAAPEDRALIVAVHLECSRCRCPKLGPGP